MGLALSGDRTGNPGASRLYRRIIGISGARKEIVYFLAPRGMLAVLLMRMQETDTSDENIKDLVGEVANTISGNARRDFRAETSSYPCRPSSRTMSRRSPAPFSKSLSHSDQLAQTFGQTGRLPRVAAAAAAPSEFIQSLGISQQHQVSASSRARCHCRYFWATIGAP